MSRFHGPQPGYKLDRGPSRKKGPKGARRLDRIRKRQEAEARQKLSRKSKIDAILDETVPEIQYVLDQLK